MTVTEHRSRQFATRLPAGPGALFSPRRAKIVCTLGPAVATDSTVRALMETGMDIARLNFSHGEHIDHGANYDRVRSAAAATGRSVGILADLQGPRIRLGRFVDGTTVWATGETVRVTVDDCPGDHDRVSTTYARLAEASGVVLADPGPRGLAADAEVRGHGRVGAGTADCARQRDRVPAELLRVLRPTSAPAST